MPSHMRVKTDHECPKCYTKFSDDCCVDYAAYRTCVEIMQEIADLFDAEGYWVEGSSVLQNEQIVKLKHAIAQAQEEP